MEKIDLVPYVRFCISKLVQRYKKNMDDFQYESHFHADLYVILNMENKKFWDDISVIMGDKQNFRGTDLVITNPDDEKDEVFLEVKYYSQREKEIEDCLRTLSSYRKGYNLLLYIGDDKENNKNKKRLLKKFSIQYPKVEIIYYHPEEKDILILKEGKIDENPLKNKRRQFLKNKK